MGDSPASTPKLPIFSLPRTKPPEQPGLLTPPLHPGAAIPFEWEEAPGIPWPCHNRSPCLPLSAVAARRCLDLPPRLLNDRLNITNNSTTPSPTTVLEGPYYGKKLTKTLSFRRAGSRGHMDARENVAFGSTRWAAFGFSFRLPLPERKERNGIEVEASGVGDGVSLSEFLGGDSDHCGDAKVKITRVRRRKSLLSLSPSRSHLWASIYEGFKQVVPWRRTQASNNSRRSQTGTIVDY